MPTHAEARELAKAALVRRFGTATPGEIKALAGIGWLETNYGTGWKGEGSGSNNIGAIHADRSWSGDVFLSTDTKPNADGTSTSYVTRFRKYPTAVEGWADFAGVAMEQNGRSIVRERARANDWSGVSTALYKTGYYEGFGSTDAERISNHRNALERAIALGDGGAPMDLTPSITIRVQNPQGEQIGITAVSDADAPGMSILAATFGAPYMIAYPNGWRFLQFALGVQIPAKIGHPYTAVDQQRPVSFGWESGAVIGIIGIAVTIFVATLQIQPGRRAHA